TTQDRAEVGLFECEEADAQLPLGGHPDPVTTATERFGDARYDPDVAPAVGVPVEGGGLVSATAGNRDWFERECRADRSQDLGRGHHAGCRPRAVGVEGHELDVAQAKPTVAGEGGQVDNLVVVHAADDDRVHLHRVQPGGDSGVDTFKD